jgi:hypothetical protein
MQGPCGLLAELMLALRQSPDLDHQSISWPDKGMVFQSCSCSLPKCRNTMMKLKMGIGVNESSIIYLEIFLPMESDALGFDLSVLDVHLKCPDRIFCIIWYISLPCYRPVQWVYSHKLEPNPDASSVHSCRLLEQLRQT